MVPYLNGTFSKYLFQCVLSLCFGIKGMSFVTVCFGFLFFVWIRDFSKNGNVDGGWIIQVPLNSQ